MPVMRSPKHNKTNRKRTAPQNLGDDLPLSSKRVCNVSDGELDIFGDSQSFVDAVLSANTVTIEADIHHEDEPVTQMMKSDDRDDVSRDIVGMIAKLSSDMHTRFGEMNSTMDKMAKDIETKLSNKFSQMLDKRVSVEVSKIRKEVQKEMDGVKTDFREDIKEIQSQLDEVCKKSTNNNRDRDRDMNIIIRNLPESVGENLQTKVQGMIKDGLKLKDVVFTAVVRKESRQRGKPGVVIMTCRSTEDKQSVIRNKRQLKDSRKYSNVYIHNDQAHEVRVQTNNFKTLLSSFGNQMPGLRLQGSRLVMDRTDDRRSADSHNRRWERNDSDRGHNSNWRPSSSDRGDNDVRRSGNERRRT